MKTDPRWWYMNRHIKCIILMLWLIPGMNIGQVRYTDRYWPFGDHAALNFSDTANPVAGYSATLSVTNEASICDSAGNLLLYTPTSIIQTGIYTGHDVALYNGNHTVIKNGDTIRGYQAPANTRLLLPAPGNDSLIFYFSQGYGVVGSNPIHGISYSIINLYSDSGKAEVVVKNQMLYSYVYPNLGITAIRHGNGRDWYIIAYKDTPPYNNNDGAFQVFLLDQAGIHGPDVYPVSNHGFHNSPFKIIASKEGNKIAIVTVNSQLILFDFDRCSGSISNKQIILNAYNMGIRVYSAAEFSASGRYLYALTYGDVSAPDSGYSCHVYQYDTWATNIYQSEVLLFHEYPDTTGFFDGPHFYNGLSRGPDDKIYVAFYFQNKSCGIPFGQIYCPGFHNAYSDSLLVINYPDSAGSSCQVVIHGQDIAAMGGRSSATLPNNPNYQLGRLIGSPCDTLTAGIDESNPAISPSMQAMFNSISGSINIYAQGLRGKNIKMMLYDLQGRLIKTAQGKTNGSSFAYTLKVNDLRNALYIIQLQSEKEVLSAKVMLE